MNVTRSTLLLAATLTLAACGGGTRDDATEAPAADPGTGTPVPAAEAPATAEVTIRTFIFDPDPITVPAGTTITFENLDSTFHTVTAGTREQPEPDVIDANLGQGETTTWTLDEPGTYDYFCTIHSGPGMTGQVIVEA